MKIVTLIENDTQSGKDLYNEHGLSLFIQVDGKNILFDSGQSGRFIDNAKALNIDLKELDYVILSHGHYDHSGGFRRLIEEINPNIKLFLGEGFFNAKYNRVDENRYDYTGNPFDKEFLQNNNIETKYVHENMLHITENLVVFSNFNINPEFENTIERMYLKKDGEYKKDQFLDEISLGIKSDQGIIVLVGCSHVGVVNILDTIKDRTGENIHSLIGGTHLVREDDEQINKIIEYFKVEDIKNIGACHCTGKQGETMLSQQLEEIFINNNTGQILEF